ncbi:hypothetical protein LSAT2_016098 [Lamellibrachia satsuma]|nr:hypothetical protein LSAT2_016098 [Lamellibrachia satsuma]
MRRHPNVISAWDFSAADITLDTNKVIGSSDTVNVRKLLVITEQFNLTQHQREINRPSSDAVLDLLFYTNPNLIQNIEKLMRSAHTDDIHDVIGVSLVDGGNQKEVLVLCETQQN